MKKILALCVIALTMLTAASQNIAINNSGSIADPSAMLDISANNKGLLIPRMTKDQRKAIILPKNGLVVYDTSTSSFWFYRQNAWQEMSYGTSSSDSTLLYGQQAGTLASYLGDPSGNLVLAQDSSGYFYDSGGPAGNYGNNENYFFAILTPGNVVGYKVQVISNNLENPYDSLIIYHAGDFSVPDTLTGSETATYMFPSNPVVIRFKSNFVNPAPGFVIRWDAITTPAAANNAPMFGGWHFDPHKLAMHGGFNSNNNWHSDNSGLFSLNYGYANKARGNYSVALGAYTTTSDAYATALGYGSIASGYASAAIGVNDTASGAYATALGYRTRSSGWASLVAGYNSVASGDFAFAMGENAKASGSTSIALGRNADASGSLSIVLGNNVANATYSTAIGGVGNIASNPYATAIGGVSCTASGDYSMALGNYISTNSHLGSFAIGDINPGSGLGNDASNQMLMRFGGGYKFHLNDAALAMTITNLGLVGIGTNSPDETLHVNGNIKCVSLTQTSDGRLKKDIYPLRNSLQKIMKLNGYNYHWKEPSLGPGLQIGILAQEVRQLFPELVAESRNGMLSVNYNGLIPVMIESIKEQQQQIDELKQMVDRLLKNSSPGQKN